MDALRLDSHPVQTTPDQAAHRRALLRYIFLQACLWISMLGTVSTVAGSAWRNSAYTLGIAAASVGISTIWLIATQKSTLLPMFVELMTLFVVIGILNNPLQRGMAAIMATLIGWVFIEGYRHLVRGRSSIFTNLGRVAILIGVAVLVDGRSTPHVSTLAIVALWAVGEVVWLVIDQRFLQHIAINFRLERKQKLALVVVGCVLVAYLAVKWVRNLTTVQYYGSTTSMSDLVAAGNPVHCIQEHWVEAGIDLSYLGFGGQMQCFNTEAEVQQFSEQQRASESR